MILRVYALWYRSRAVLYPLIALFVVQAIVSVVLPAIYNSSTKYFTGMSRPKWKVSLGSINSYTPIALPSASLLQVLDFTLCNGTFGGVPDRLGLYAALPRFALSGMLLVLAVTRTLKQLVDMYGATKQWQPNRYISQFARDGIYYFIVYVSPVWYTTPRSKLTLERFLEPCRNTLYNIVTVIGSVVLTTTNDAMVINGLSMAASALLCTAMPRFIITVRELYDRELRGRWQGIDTGFGVGSQNVSADTMLGSGIAFADGVQESQESETVLGDADEPGAIQLDVF